MAEQSLQEKYEELVAAGYIAPVPLTRPLEMPSTRVYVLTYISDRPGGGHKASQANGTLDTTARLP